MRALYFVLLLAACDDSAPGAKCVPGASAACACTDGSSGAQLCNSDGTFDACICTHPSTDNSSSSNNTTGGGTTSSGGGTTTSSGGGTTSSGGGTTGTTQPSDCGHPETTSWCNGAKVEFCSNGTVKVSTDCALYNQPCASGRIGGGGSFNDWHEATCGEQCPVDNASPSVYKYCKGDQLWECDNFLTYESMDCGAAMKKCTSSGCQ